MLQRRYESDVLAKEPWSQGYYRISLDSSLYLSWVSVSLNLIVRLSFSFFYTIFNFILRMQHLASKSSCSSARQCFCLNIAEFIFPRYSRAA